MTVGGRNVGAGGGGGCWWVTMAANNVDGCNALSLAVSLRVNLTSGKLCVVVGGGVSAEMRTLLAQAFDYVVDTPTDELTPSGLSTEARLTLSAWKCGFAETAVFLHPHSLVLKNCDELFHSTLKDDFALIPLATDGGGGDDSEFTTSAFVLRPHVGTFNGIMANGAKLSSTLTTLVVAHEVLSLHFKGNASANGGGGGRDEYVRLVGKNLDNNFYLSPDTKIVRFSTDTPWTLPQIPKPWVQLYQSVMSDLPAELLDNSEMQSCKEFMGGTCEEISDCGFGSKDAGVFVDSIAIVGFTCRFPGANNEDEFWTLLVEGRDETKPLPPERLFTKLVPDSPDDPPVGYLKCPIDEFDAKFFEISRRAAEYMDPQQRLLLEVVWEGLEHAGINPLSLNGSNTAVFVGLWMQEYLEYAKQSRLGSGDSKDGLGLDFQHKYLGNAVCVSSAQISHFLGLRGPSVAFEAGCASALTGLHYACEALKARDTDLALSCGVNITTAGMAGVLGEHDSILHSKDGKCKTFDESADGFARAEACVTLVLKRMSDAVRDGNEIFGIIRGTALNHCGAGSPLGTPNVATEQLVLETALHVAGVGPNEVSYVEAHGTGTAVGDVVEFQALNHVFGSATTGRTHPLHVGSVKTNIGHTEAASGLAGMVKVLLAMRHRTIPPHLHVKTLNPKINLEEIPAIIPHSNTEWRATSKWGLVAGVSSFGFSGTNVHVIVQEPPNKKLQLHPTTHKTDKERTNHVLALSAKSEHALQQLVCSYIKMLESADPQLRVADLAFSANTGRAHFRQFRLAIVAKDTAQLLVRLKKENHISRNRSGDKPKIAFLFTGQGSQYVTMAQSLYATHPLFRATFDKCANLLRRTHGMDLCAILGYSPQGSGSVSLDDSIHSQPAIFCIEVCLAQLWTSFGILPDWVLGHSVGEFAAAVVAGVLTLEEAMTLVVGRSKLVSGIRPGAMLVVKASHQLVKRLISDFEGEQKEGGGSGSDHWVDIAAINSTGEVVVSGPMDAIAKLESFAHNNLNGVGTQRLAATHAFHSRDMDRVLEEYHNQIVRNLRYEGKSQRCRFMSGTFGREMNLTEFESGDYWLRHLRDAVNFSAAFGRLVEGTGGGSNVFVEVGPQPILLALGMSLVAPEELCWCPSIRKAEDNWMTLLTSLSKMYMFGVDVGWGGFDAHFPRRRLPLPTYPWQHEKFWLKGVGQTESVVVNANKAHPLLGKRVPSPLVDSITYCNSISLSHFAYIREHKVADKVILPAAGYLELILGAGRDVLCGGDNVQLQLTVENLVMESALPLVEEQPAMLQVVLIPQTLNHQLHYTVTIHLQTSFDPSGSDSGRWKKLASAEFVPCGTVSVPSTITGNSDGTSSSCDIDQLKASLCPRDSVDDIYARFVEAGLNLGPTFQTMQRVWSSETELLVEVSSPEGGWGAYTCHPLVLDAMIQSCVAEFMRRKGGDKGLYLPIKINKCVIMSSSALPHNQTDKLLIHYSTMAESELPGLGGTTSGNLHLYNEHGIQLAYMQGVEFISTTVPAFLRILAASYDQELPDFYEEIWHPQLGPQQLRLRPSPDHSRLEECEAEAMRAVGYKPNYFHSETARVRNANIDSLCHLYIVRALRSLGWNHGMGDQVSIPQFIAMAKILPNHKQLIARWFDVLEEVGYVSMDTDHPEVGRTRRQLPTMDQVDTQIEELHAWFTENYDEVEHEFVTNCGEQLPHVLTGKTSAHSVLFPQSPGVVGAAAYYRSSLGNYLHVLDAILVGAQLKRMIQTNLTNQREGEKGGKEEVVFRVLEVGAGTGSTTAYVLTQLDSVGIPYEYTVTDISPTLVNEAKKRHSGHPHMKCKVFDIEVDPKTQGFAPHYFDCIVADNVLHATRSLRETLTNLRHLLVPSGLFVFSELVGNMKTIDISFGLLDSWWRFSDSQVRTKSPVVPTHTWFELLRSSGFVDPTEYNNVDGMEVRSFVAFANTEKFTAAALTTTNSTNNWLVFGLEDDPVTLHLAHQLRLIGTNVIEVYGDDGLRCIRGSGCKKYFVNPLNPCHFDQLCNQLQQNDNSGGDVLVGILYLWGVHATFAPNADPAHTDLDAHLRQTSGGLLHVIQTFSGQSLQWKWKPRLVVVTRGGQYVGEGQEPTNPLSSTLSGILISYLNEFPNHSAVTIDMDPHGNLCDDSSTQSACLDIFHQLWQNEVEPQVAFRAHKKYVRRLFNCAPYKPSLVFPNAERYQVEGKGKGAGAGLHVGVALHKSIGRNEVEVKVITCALNFASLSTQTEFGLDFAGLVSGAPPGGSQGNLRVGDRVFGLVSGGALASHVVVPANCVTPIPQGMSFEEAVTLPLPFMTALYFLVHKGQLKATDRLLIHSASGGVGLAAIQVARAIGAEIYATAGTTRKRTFLHSLGIQHVYNSRDTKYMEQILWDTNGAGVTIVMNSLNNNDHHQSNQLMATLDVLAHGGRFLEMSPTNVRLTEMGGGVGSRPDVVYHTLDLQSLIKLSESSPSGRRQVEGWWQVRKMFLAGLALKKYRPLPYTRFPLGRLQDALLFLQEGKQIGRVVVRTPTTRVEGGQIEHKEELFNPYSTYMICGGLGGLGLEVAKWMVDSGAKHLVLVGRSPPTPPAQHILSELKGRGSNVLVQSADISDFAACKRLLAHIGDPSTELPPLKGIMQATGVLADNLLINQDLDAFMRVYKSKVNGTWNLHFLTLNYNLEHFVLFSSMVSGLGGLGQANHSAANKYLDSFAKFRTQLGLPCCSVNWGAWSEVGVAVSKEGYMGLKSISPAQGVAALQRAMLSQLANTTVYHVGDLTMLTSTYNIGAYFSLVEERKNKGRNEGLESNRIEIESCVQAMRDSNSVEREIKIKEFIEGVVRDTLRLPDSESIDPDQELREVGIDSMMAMEVRSKIQQLLTGFELISLNELQENLTVHKLARVVNAHMNKKLTATANDEFVMQIKQDSVLPDDILHSSMTTMPKSKKKSRVLLTGVTGHVAPYILEKLLSCDPQMEVWCLIRAPTDQVAGERLEAVLHELGLLPAVDMNRTKCVAGDVAMAALGLSTELYDQLCLQIDSVMHCAAVVNLSLPYIGDIRTNNVLGLLNVLRFATSGRIKPLQFASSISAQTRLADDGAMLDEFPSMEGDGESLKTGYHVSKFVCEKLLGQAVARGLPVSVVRHNYLVGDSRSGLGPTWRNPIVLFLAACVRIGKFPDIGAQSHMSTVPVDTSAKVAVALFLDPKAEQGMYNINNPKVRRFLDLTEVIRCRGFDLEMVPYSQWTTALTSRGIELDLDVKWLVETLLPSDVFNHNVVINTIKNGSKVDCQRMWANSPRLKKHVPNVDDLMTDPMEMVKLQLDYYENTFGNLKSELVSSSFNNLTN